MSLSDNQQALPAQTVGAMVQPGRRAKPVPRVGLAAVFYRLVRSGAGISGLVLVSLIVLTALLADVVAPYPPNQSNVRAVLQTPSLAHLLGTDELGRDMLSRIIHGSRVSLLVSLGSLVIALGSGVIIGLLAGYFGGRLDSVLMRILDVMFAFPAILLALALVAALGPALTNVMLALGIVTMPRFARVTRASTLSASEEVYVEAARSVGNSDIHVLTRYILPNILSPIIVQASVSLAAAVLSEASLSFLGLGVQPPQPSWGGMLNAGKAYMEQLPYLTIFPGLAVMVTVLGFNLLGDGLRDALDPRLRR